VNEHHLGEDLAAMADGGRGLADARRLELEQHVAACADCRAAVASAQVVLRAVDERVEAAPSESFDRALSARLDALDRAAHDPEAARSSGARHATGRRAGLAGRLPARLATRLAARLAAWVQMPRFVLAGAAAALLVAVVVVRLIAGGAGATDGANGGPVPELAAGADEELEVLAELELFEELDVVEDLDVIEELEVIGAMDEAG
jgi:hypothetical protein